MAAWIPYGRVTTCGHIAGFLKCARTVGWTLRASRATRWPCRRVVNRYGGGLGRYQFGEPHLMELLRSEDVSFDLRGRTDLSQHLWIPGESSPLGPSGIRLGSDFGMERFAPVVCSRQIRYASLPTRAGKCGRCVRLTDRIRRVQVPCYEDSTSHISPRVMRGHS